MNSGDLKHLKTTTSNTQQAQFEGKQLTMSMSWECHVMGKRTNTHWKKSMATHFYI